MLDVLIRTLVFGTLTAVLGWRINRLWASAANLFWASWLFLLLSAQLCVAFGLLTDIPERSFELVREAYWGALAGSLAGIFLAGQAKEKICDTPASHRFLLSSKWILDKLLVPYVVVMMLLGTIHLFQRFSQAGFDIYRLADVRRAVLGEAWPWVARLGNYVAPLGLLLAVLLGVTDAPKGPSTRRLFWLWLAAAPQGIAFGGRGWTMAALMIYSFSFLLSRSFVRQPSPLRRFLPVGVLVFLGLWTFTVLGTIRNRDLSATDGADQLSVGNWDLQQRLMTFEWIAASIVAVGAQGDFLASLQPSGGTLTFAYFTAKAADLGFADHQPGEDWKNWLANDLPSQENGWTWCVPPTAIAYFIHDYGETGMPVAMAAFIMMLQWLSVRWVGQGLSRHIAAFLAFYAAFNTIGTLVAFTAMTVLPLLIAGFAEILIRYNWPKISRSSGRQAPNLLIAPNPVHHLDATPQR
jgi:oligosaccharide repeat unit polymerase